MSCVDSTIAHSEDAETGERKGGYAMKVFQWVVLGMVCLGLVAPASAKIVTKDVEYKDGDVVLQGYLAYDDVLGGKLPGIMIVHEWDGLGKYVKDRAEQLAKLGYAAFGADIYGKGVRPKDMEESKKESAIYTADRQLMRRRAMAGFEAMKKQGMVDPEKTAAIGYCFGGGVVLELARSGAPVQGVVSFHGNLSSPTPQDAKNIRAKILVMHGADDPNVPPEQVSAFEKEMREAKVNWQMNIYGGAVHRFTNPAAGDNPQSGAAYNRQADIRSWRSMQLFFDELFLGR